MMQGCPSCEMAYMQQKGARKKDKYRITYNTLNVDLLDMVVPDNNNERYGVNAMLHGKAFGDLEMERRKTAHCTARAFHDSKSYIEALGHLAGQRTSGWRWCTTTLDPNLRGHSRAI